MGGKPGLLSLLKCWKSKPTKSAKDALSSQGSTPGKEAGDSNRSQSSIPPEDEDVKEKNKKDKSAQVSEDGKSKSQSLTEIEDEKDAKNQQSGGKKGKNGSGNRCDKCHKKKSGSHHHKDRKSCKCKRGGYCNTNTIIFPNDFKQPVAEPQENKYFELLKEIIKDETRKNNTDVCDFKREMDRQRDEIREIKNLIMQSLLSNKKDSSDQDFSGKRGKNQSDSASAQQDSANRDGRKNKTTGFSDDTPGSASTIGSTATNADKKQKGKKQDKPGFWGGLFGKRK